MTTTHTLVILFFLLLLSLALSLFFFFNDTATTEIYTLSLHDALPIYRRSGSRGGGLRRVLGRGGRPLRGWWAVVLDRKSTRLNSSHGYISYAVFCLKKKKNTQRIIMMILWKRGRQYRASSQALHTRVN